MQNWLSNKYISAIRPKNNLFFFLVALLLFINKFQITVLKITTVT